MFDVISLFTDVIIKEENNVTIDVFMSHHMIYMLYILYNFITHILYFDKYSSFC